METIIASSEGADVNELGGVSVVQVIPGQAIQVHCAPKSIISAASLSAMKAFQVIGSDGDNAISTDDDSESKKRRELLARRPSYRRILNELSSTDNPTAITVAKIEEESEDGMSSSDEDVATNLTTHSVGGVPIQSASLIQPSSLKVLPAQALQIAAHGDAAAQGLQTLTMTNVSGTNAVSPTGGATLVQYAQAADGQFLIPVSTIGGGSIQYQLASTGASLGQGVVMATAPSSGQVPEETSRKRELRLLKNREAARECRRKKKEYVKCLENRVAVLENQNKTLIEELKSLKELYCQKEAQS